MKIKTVNIIIFLFTVILLINCRIFYLHYVNPINGFLLTILTVVLTIFVKSRKKSGIEQTFRMTYIKKLCWFTVMVFVAFLFISEYKYPSQTIRQTFIGESGQYSLLLILLVYPIMTILQKKGGVQWIFRMMNLFSVILYTLVLVQFIVYNVNGAIFLPSFSSSTELLLLRGSLRISLSWFGNFMIIYNFYMFYRESHKPKRTKLMYLFIFILGLVDCLLIQRVRGVTWVITVCIFYIAFSDRNTNRGLLKKALALIVILIGLFGTDIVSNFLSSMSVYGERSYSTTARLYAIDYYWNLFKRNPWFGIGFADGTVYYSLVHGNGTAFMSDVGIFGQLARLGIFVIPIYIYPLARSGYKLYKLKNSTIIEDYPLYFSLVLYTALTSFTYFVLSSQNLIILWPVFLTVTEYVIEANKNKVKILEP